MSHWSHCGLPDTDTSGHLCRFIQCRVPATVLGPLPTASHKALGTHTSAGRNDDGEEEDEEEGEEEEEIRILKTRKLRLTAARQSVLES